MLDAKPRTLALLAVALACEPQTPADTTTTESTSAPAGSETTTASDDSGEVAALGIEVVEPALVDPDGGSQLLVHGTGFEPGMLARIAGVEVAALEWIDATTLRQHRRRLALRHGPSMSAKTQPGLVHFLRGSHAPRARRPGDGTGYAVTSGLVLREYRQPPPLPSFTDPSRGAASATQIVMTVFLLPPVAPCNTHRKRLRS